MKWRISLLTVTAAAAGLSAVANALTAPAEQTRLGASIQKDLAQRDRQAAARNRSLDMREQAARAAEQRMKAAAAAQPAGQTQPKAANLPTADEGENSFDELARIYQAMKPKAAAPVFEQLAMDVQVKVAERMRERSTAQIMAAMTPKAAAALTMAMAQKGKGPGWTAVPPSATQGNGGR